MKLLFSLNVLVLELASRTDVPAPVNDSPRHDEVVSEKFSICYLSVDGGEEVLRNVLVRMVVPRR